MIGVQQVLVSTHDRYHAWHRVSRYVVTFVTVDNRLPYAFVHCTFVIIRFGLFTRLFINPTMCIRALFTEFATTVGIVEQAFWRVPLFTEWIGASSFEVILSGPSRHSTTGTLSPGTSGSRRICHTLLAWKKEFGDEFGCVIFARSLERDGNCNVSSRTMPVGLPLPTISKILCPHCFSFIISVSGVKILISYIFARSFFFLLSSICDNQVLFSFWWISRSYNSSTVLSFSDSRILNLYNPSKMSSHGIFVKDNRIPSHIESNSWISSFRRPLVNTSAKFSTESLAPVTRKYS